VAAFCFWRRPTHTPPPSHPHPTRPHHTTTTTQHTHTGRVGLRTISWRGTQWRIWVGNTRTALPRLLARPLPPTPVCRGAACIRDVPAAFTLPPHTTPPGSRVFMPFYSATQRCTTLHTRTAHARLPTPEAERHLSRHAAATLPSSFVVLGAFCPAATCHLPLAPRILRDNAARSPRDPPHRPPYPQHPAGAFWNTTSAGRTPRLTTRACAGWWRCAGMCLQHYHCTRLPGSVVGTWPVNIPAVQDPTSARVSVPLAGLPPPPLSAVWTGRTVHHHEP